MTGIWKNLLKRLDTLDGAADDRYLEQPLILAKMCREREDSIESGRDKDPAVLSLQREDGRSVFLDCDAMAQRLSVLVGAAEKMPYFRFVQMSPKQSATMPKSRRDGILSSEGILGYFYINEMMSMLIMGARNPETPLSKLFESVSFASYSDTVREIARDYREVRAETKTARSEILDTVAGYKILEHLGKKFGFDPKPFKPAKTRRPQKKPDPIEIQVPPEGSAPT